MTVTKIDLKHLLSTAIGLAPWANLLRDLIAVLDGDSETLQGLQKQLSDLTDTIIGEDEALYRELDLLADELTLAIPEYEIVLEHNSQTRQDYILVERKEITK